MASLFDKLSSISEFDKVFGGGQNAAGYGTASTVETAAKKTFDDEVRARLAQIRQASAASTAAEGAAVGEAAGAAGASEVAAAESAGVLSRAGGAIRSMVGKVTGGIKALTGPTAVGAYLAGHSQDAGAGSDVIRDASTGAVLTKGVSQPTQTQAQDEETLKKLDVLNARAAQRADERTARVNKVIADSQAATPKEIAPPKATPPAFPKSWGDIARYLTDLSQYKNQVRLENQAFLREHWGAQAAAKILEKQAGNEAKVIPVESATTKGSVYGGNLYTLDEKGDLKVQRVGGPTTAEAHAEAKARIAKASNPAAEKARVNKVLKEKGYPELP